MKLESLPHECAMVVKAYVGDMVTDTKRNGGGRQKLILRQLSEPEGETDLGVLVAKLQGEIAPRVIACSSLEYEMPRRLVSLLGSKRETGEQ
jgi:hypothetical protein